MKLKILFSLIFVGLLCADSFAQYVFNPNGSSGETWTYVHWQNSSITFPANASYKPITMNPYNGWDYIDVTFATALDLTNSAQFQITFKGIAGAIGKYMQISLMNVGTSSVNNNPTYFLPITANSQTATLDFSQPALKGSIALNHITGLRIYFYSSNTISSIATNLIGEVDITSMILGTGVNTVFAPAAPSYWQYEDAGNTVMKSTNSSVVNVGTSESDEPTLASAFYKFNVKGRTNVIGNTNSLSLWYSPLNGSSPIVNGGRHYLVFDNLGDRTILNSALWMGGSPSAPPVGQHLILQNLGQGNLGIGALPGDPSEKLHVSDRIRWGNNLLSTDQNGSIELGNINDVGTGTPYIDFHGNNVGTDYNVRLINDENYSLSVLGVLKIRKSATQSYGNPYLMTVDGKIHARGIRCDVDSWADFVFDKNYQLMNLQHVAKYIDANKHLPGIPSESEVLKEGIDVVEMNTLLLKKVEELTLYVIQQQKQIDGIKAQLSK